jgi:predicted ester cyclase
MEKNMLNLKSQTPQEITLHKAIAGWGTAPHWQQVWADTCAADIRLHFCGMADPVIGAEAAIGFNAALFMGFPALQQTITAVCADGAHVVYRHRLVGIHSGPFLGLAATHRPVDISGMAWTRVQGGMVAEEWYELNHDELKRQLGIS